jgi:hypothetical protein
MKKLTVFVLATFYVFHLFGQQPIYDVTAGNGNGLRFWSDNSYKIHMGSGPEYFYGPVQDYSIKMNMNGGSPNRGWTWGVAGLTPVAAINALGKMQIADGLTVGGNIVLPSFSGNKQIYTWSEGDSNWRIGMSASPGFTRDLTNQHVEYLTYSSGVGQGFAVGVNNGQSSFEVHGADHTAFFRGNVGIGTTTPSEKLEVNGNLNVGLNSGAATGYGNRLNLRGLDDAASFDPIWLARYNVGANQTELRINIGDDSGGDDAFTVGNFFHGDGQWKTFLKVLNNGNVGIGTTNPAYKLDVAGTINATSVLINGQPLAGGGSSQWAASGSNVSFISGNVGIGTTTPNFKVQLATSNSLDGLSLRHSNGAWANFFSPSMTGGAYNEITQPGDAGVIFGNDGGINTVSNGFVIAPHRGNTSGLRINNNGNVGIGITNSAYKLDVAGTINATNILINGQPLAGGGSSQWATNGNNISYAAGNVGIGTTSPSAKLNVYNSNNKTEVIIGNPSTATGGFTSLLMGTSADTNGFGYIAAIKSSGTAYGDVILNPLGGNVGIGTTQTDAKLTVNGTVHTKEVKVDLSVPGPDYVFEPTYDLKPLAEIETYIKENKHLPEVPSAKEMEKNGVQLGEMNMLLLKKVEELTLHLIEQQKEIAELKKTNDLIVTKMKIQKQQ